MDSFIVVASKEGMRLYFEFRLAADLSRVGSCVVEAPADGTGPHKIAWFGIDDAFRGNGFGQTCYAMVERYLKFSGVRWVEVFAHTGASYGFWKKMGYKPSRGSLKRMLKEL